MNNNILKVCPSDSAYKYRPETDVLFKLPDGSFNYTGLVDNAIRHIEKIQSMREDLWKLFVKQFRSNVDDDKKWRIEYWGKMMRGACFTYQYTQNEELYNVLCETIRDLMSTQDELGRITTYSVEAEFDGWDIWGRKYVMLGFQYFMDICRDEEFKKEILDCMCRHADYIISKVGRPEEGKKQITVCTTHWKGVNSSSILEPYVRLYNLTGEQKYLDFAEYIIDNGGMEDGDMFELICEGKLYPYELPITKAYETMSCLEGLLEYSRVKKIDSYKDALLKFAEKVIETDITVIGCSGCTHELFDFSTKRQTVTTYNDIMQETCVTVTWIKFCYQLLCATGCSRLADAIELSSYNSMLGSVNSYNSTQNGGMAFDSYAPLFMDTRCRKIGGFQYMENKTEMYGCCACIGAAGTAMIALSSVMQSENGLYMNLYVPGTVSVKTPAGTDFKLSIDTKYPAESKINVFVKGAKGDEEFTLAFRIPSWCKNASMKVNGEKIDVTPGTYANVCRKWNCCDKIELDFEMKMQLLTPPHGGVEGDEGSKNVVALVKGPIAFARDLRLGQAVDGIVDIVCDKDGYVDAVPSSTADFETMQEYKIPMKDGSFITVIDYQSAGKTWDEKSMMTVWMPTKNFWDFDETKSVLINSRLAWPAIDKASGLVVKKTDELPHAVWFIEKNDDGTVYLRLENGKYLCAKFDDVNGVYNAAVGEKSDETSKWHLDRAIVNRYRLTNDKLGLSVVYAYNRNNFILWDIKKDMCINGNNLPNNAYVAIRNA